MNWRFPGDSLGYSGLQMLAHKPIMRWPLTVSRLGRKTGPAGEH